jgi:hypothetical protein
LCSSIEAVNLDSNGDVSVNKDSRLSPVSLQSPHVEFVESSLEQVKYRLVKDMLPEAAKSTDWLWDWKNRSEAGVAPEKYYYHSHYYVGTNNCNLPSFLAQQPETEAAANNLVPH